MNIKQEIQELQKQIDEKIKSLQSIFKDGLRDLLVAHKDNIANINCYLNNHDFNDGDTTYFSLNYEDMTLVFSDELGNETEYDGYPKNKEKEELRKAFIDFFAEFDVDGFYETLFGEFSERLYFRADGVKLVIE